QQRARGAHRGAARRARGRRGRPRAAPGARRSRACDRGPAGRTRSRAAGAGGARRRGRELVMRARIPAIAALAVLLGFSCARGEETRVQAPDPRADFAAAIRTETLAAAERAPEQTLFGRVVDPVPLVDAVLQRAAARRALEFAEIEQRRVEALAAHDR